jgi:hypothetical protein
MAPSQAALSCMHASGAVGCHRCCCPLSPHTRAHNPAFSPLPERRWRQRIDPVLHDEEGRSAFDIQMYQRRILSRLQDATAARLDAEDDIVEVSNSCGLGSKLSTLVEVECCSASRLSQECSGGLQSWHEDRTLLLDSLNFPGARSSARQNSHADNV